MLRMALRPSRILTNCNNFLRNYSSTSSLINVTINGKTGIATATLQKPPVNSLSLEFVKEIDESLKNLEKENCKGLILTSSSSKVFCAGLDIKELYQIKPDRFKQFWRALQDFWITFYASSYPTVAVVNGHSIAGGCMLALCCEYRIMMNNFTIGLNESQLGILIPELLKSAMVYIIGQRQAELALTSGHMFKTEEALKVGLIDEMVSTKEDGILKAEKFLERFARIPPFARSITKKALREADLQDHIRKREEELETWLEFLSRAEVQNSIAKYLEAMKKK